MVDNVIYTENLTVYYGKHRGIEDVDLAVEKGEVFGFLGPNGAGKTTTQRVLLDVIRPTSGRAAIFGLDCQEHGPQIRQQVGYLPGELSLYSNMRGRAFLDMMAGLYGYKVDRAYRRELVERLDLDPSRKIKEYSRGNKQKVGIIMAFSGRPDLLILDEPTTGLDPLVQQTVLELVREARDEGRTVFFSSHILPEVQAVCDRVGIIRDGHLVKTERVETLVRQQFKRLHLTLQQPPPPDLFAFEGVAESARDGQTVMLEIRQNLDKVLEASVPYGIVDVETLPVTLEEVFLAYYGRAHQGENHV
jgi:ABC-2 type transport system ATP-binding protein